MTFDPINTFPQFYGNDAIRCLADQKRWTISDSDKMPINMNDLLHRGLITGASMYKLSEDTLTLGELTQAMPNAKNCAYFFRALDIRYILLDIESTCPDHIKHRLLKLAETDGLYTETSMSGKGYHILLPLPPNFLDFPNATSKAAIRHPEGWYEVLIDHWVTFTRNPIPDELLEASFNDPANDDVSWVDIYAELAGEADKRISANNPIDIENGVIEPDDYSQAQRHFDKELTDIVIAQVEQTPRKDLSEFNNDTSRWEFSALSLTVRKTAALLSERLRMSFADSPPARSPYDSTEVTADHIARIAYPAIISILPHREKHDGTRNGLPYLLYQIIEAIAIVDIPQLNNTYETQKVVNGRWLNQGYA